MEIQYTLSGVKVESFSFSQIIYPIDQEKTNEINKLFNFTSKPDIGIIKEHNIVRIVFNVRGFLIGDEKDYICVRVCFDFIVTDLINIIEKDGKGLEKDTYRPFLAAIISVCYSTTRGMLIEKLMGTNLSKFILPIINPNIFLLPSIVKEKPKKDSVYKQHKS